MFRNLLIVSLALVAAPIMAQAAGLYAQNIPGSACVASNRFHENYFEYKDSRLVNTESNPWSVFISSCPVSEFVPGTTALEIRGVVQDADQRDAWCALYDIRGVLLDSKWVTFSGDIGFAAFHAPTSSRDSGLVSATVQCLIHPGAAMRSVEIIWKRP